MESQSNETTPGRVLIVDDEKDIASVLSDVLTDRGYVTQMAHDGREGLAAFEADPFDLVITDLKMPGMGGLELLSAIRERDDETIVIVMTGFATVETAIEALKNGAYDYILKPFKVSELLQIVERAFEKIHLAAENLQLREQIALLKLSEAVASSLSLDEVLSILVEAAQKEVGADGVELLFRPPGSREFSRRLTSGEASLLPRIIADIESLEVALHDRSCLQYRGEELAALMLPDACQAFQYSISIPLRRGGEILGVLNAYSRSTRRGFLPRDEKALMVLGDRAATSLENALLYSDLENTFRETIEGLALALEAKDSYTHGHSENVTRLCVMIAEEMGCDEVFVGTLRQAGLLHDIGKIGISGDILNKPGRLTPEEYEIIKSHPRMGRRILENISFLREVLPIVYHHHERFDGFGYPEGLKAHEIPLGSRVMIVADTYDAMTSNRPYRDGLGHETAIEELRRCSGSQFDPLCVEAFLRMCLKNGVP